MIDKFSYDQDKVSKFIGKSRSHVANCLRLLNLPKDVLDLIEKNKISPGHAKILVGLENASFLARKIIDKNLSVRQAENLVRFLKSNKVFKPKIKNANLNSLEKNLIDKTGLNISIKNKKNNTGSVTFEYKNLDQLNRIIDVIKINY